MKKGNLKRSVASTLAGLMCVLSVPAMPTAVLNTAIAASAGTTLSVGNGRTQYKEDNVDGYSYEIWLDNTGGSGSMTLGSGGAFNTEWSAQVSAGNFLARRGRNYDASKKATEYGPIVMDYAADYSASSQGNSRLCVYGWFKDPLVEYYIIEDWVNWRPSGQSKTVTIDGAEYEIFQNDHTGPTILGDTRTFKQYFSVRKQKRTSGTITVSDHFKAWAAAGWNIGNLTEVALNVEGWESSGKANVSKLTIGSSGGSSSTTTPVTTTPVQTVKADANGYYFNNDFESGIGDWEGRGDAKVSKDTANAADGNGSLYVSGRGDNWHGAAIKLDSAAFVPGNTYSFGTAVMQKTESSTSMKLTLQYTDSTGTEQYDEVASATAQSGKWTTLNNSSYTIPSGASDMVLYVEAPDSLTDFYIDSAMAGDKGKEVKVGTSKTDTSSTVVTTSKQNPTSTSTTASQGTGLKGKFAPWFKIGTSVSPNELSSGGSFIKENYNSITPENELKPDSILDQQACQQKGNNVNTQINLSRAAQTLKFCEENGIALRGHTFVWYSQTPDWFFKENFSSNGAWVSKEVMDQRLESMIKNTFEALKTQYPKLNVYSYDVCNELFKNDGGGMRPAGNPSNAGSYWVQVYGDDSFVINAFKYARKYAPSGCKLYINDYNEYIPAKTDDIINMVKTIQAAGDYIDGIGMQSHLATNYPDAKTYETALNKFLATGLEVQITELDITCSDFTAQADLYEDIFEIAMKNADKIPALTTWGTQDPVSWRREQNPLLFSSGYKPKAAYDKVVALTETMPAPNPTNNDTPASQNPSTDTPATSTQASANVTLWGDANVDAVVNLADAVAIMQSLANPSSYKLTDQGAANGDVNLSGNGITNADALSIQKYMLGTVTKLPESYSETKTNTTTTAKQTTTTTTTKTTTTTAPKSQASGQKFSVGNGQNRFADDNVDGYSYEIWLDQTGGSGSMTLGSGGTFDTEWSAQVSKGNFLARRGKNYDRTKKATDVGDVVLDYAADYSASSQGNSRLCVYGWMVDPLVEYYIIEDWVNWRPTAQGAAQTVTVDGAEYEIFQLDHTGPTILGDTRTFKQYFSVRKQKRTSGTITVSDHFKAWAKAGWNIGNLTEVALNVEGWESSGKANVSKLTITESKSSGNNDSTSDSTAQTTPGTTTTTLDPSKPMIAVSFDDGAVGSSPTASSMRILNALADQGFHATFFYVGSWTQQKGTSGSEEIKYACSKGMEIANHTWTHPQNLPSMGVSGIQNEVNQTASLLKSITGAEPAKLLRLPYLNNGPAISQALPDYGLVTCQIDTQDWNNASADQIYNTLKQAFDSGSGNGAVVLCHETYDTTAAAIEKFAPYAKSKGWQIASIGEMYAAKGKSIPGGQEIKKVY